MSEIFLGIFPGRFISFSRSEGTEVLLSSCGVVMFCRVLEESDSSSEKTRTVYILESIRALDKRGWVGRGYLMIIKG